MVDRTVNIRLSLKDGETVKRGLMSLGVDGQRALERIERASVPASRSLMLVDGAMAKVKATALGFGATLLAGASFGALQQMVADVARIGEEADRAGLKIQDLQSLGFAARQAGSSQDEIVSMFQKLNQELGEAENKGNELKKIFDANGISLRNANGELMTQRQAFFTIVDLITNAKNQQDATNISMAAFGRSAADSLPFLQQGVEKIKEAEQAAYDAGQVIDEALVRKADEFDDAWTNAVMSVKAAMSGWLIEEIALAKQFFEQIINAPARIKEKWGFLLGTTGDQAQLDREQADAIRSQIAAAETNSLLAASLPDLRQKLADIEARVRGAAGRPNEHAMGTMLDTGSARSAFGPTAMPLSPVDPEKPARAASATRALSEAQKQVNQVLEEGRRVYADTRTAAESYEAEVERLEMLLAKGAISQDTFNRALAKAKETLNESTAKLREEQLKGMREILEGPLDILGSAFEQFARDRKVDFDAILTDFRSLVARMSMEWLKSALIGGGSVQGGGLLGGGLLGNLFGGLFGGGGASAAGAAAAAGGQRAMAGPVLVRQTTVNHMGGQARSETTVRGQADGSVDIETAIYSAVDRRNTETMPARMATGFGIAAPVRQRR